MDNIFREAQALLREKSISELNEEELLTVKATDIPLTQLRMFNDMFTDEALGELAKMVEEED
ncbi:hypothetical protein ES708_00064 [subsurface metagenome]